MNNPYLPHLATIEDIRDEATGERAIKTFKVVFQDENVRNSFDFQPGQCAMVSLLGVGECFFVISSSPTQKGYLEFSVMKLGKVIWYKKGDFLYVRLPSGRNLAYHKPEIHEMSLTHMGINSKTKEYERQTTWGGILVQNVCEGVARDIMVTGMFTVEENGYKVLLTVHDEVMSERKKGMGSLRAYNHMLSNVPFWAKDCPVKVNGWRGRRYKKV